MSNLVAAAWWKEITPAAKYPGMYTDKAITAFAAMPPNHRPGISQRHLAPGLAYHGQGSEAGSIVIRQLYVNLSSKTCGVETHSSSSAEIGDGTGASPGTTWCQDWQVLHVIGPTLSLLALWGGRLDWGASSGIYKRKRKEKMLSRSVCEKGSNVCLVDVDGNTMRAGIYLGYSGRQLNTYPGTP